MSAADDREARLAAALRANLRRRKAAGAAPRPAGETEAGTSRDGQAGEPPGPGTDA